MNDFNLLASEISHFLVVYEQRSINGAARKSGLDAGNISRAVSKLERALDADLFVRHKTGLSPTHLCDRFYAAVVDAQKSFSRKIADAGSSPRRIRIGFQSAIGYSHFSEEIIAAMIELNLEPEFTIAPSIQLLEMIKKREMDFVLSHDSVAFPGLISRPLGSEGLVLCSRTAKPQRVLLIHPDMLGLERIVQTLAYEKRWNLRDYFLIGKLLERSESLMGILPETLLSTISGVKVIKSFPKVGRITALSWPGSVGIELLKRISK